MQGWIVVIIAIAYVTLLFAIASLGDRAAAAKGAGDSRPFIYSLSLAIYCTSWTFFGSVGLASERGLEFVAIYVGPVLVFLFGLPLLSRIVRLAKAEKITSIADFLAARYGKSFAVGLIATLIAIVGAVPYIALQLKAISGSVSLMVEHYSGAPPSFDPFLSDISLIVAMLLALFAVLFGTRHADATEHQNGLVLAVAVESVVKLAAFLAVGLLVTFVLAGGPGGLIAALAADERAGQALAHPTSLGTWLVMTGLSGFAIIMLPRQFYVMIVENRSELELRTAGWVFPLYLVLINLFVLPIALAGAVMVGDRTSADLYVLSLPLLAGHDVLAMIAFIGGLSAATAMVIVASVALSIMISNDLVIPLFVRRLLKNEGSETEDWSALILNIRRAAIFTLLFIAFLYYRESTTNIRLASIGLMSFAAIAQFAPAFFGGLVWRGANARGAALGMAAGIAVWAYTLLFPSLAGPGTDILVHGPFGLAALRPQALFGTVAEPLNHGVMWSLSINALFFVLGSLSRASVPLERIQAAIFVPRDASPMPSLRRFRTAVTVNDLKDTISRYLGVERTERSFQSFEATDGAGLSGNDPASMSMIRFSEQLLASAVGSASARLILSLLFQRNDSASRDTFRLLDDATEALQHNRDLLQIALDQMEQGITVFDKDFRLTCWNRQYRALFDLPDEMGQVGVSLDRILRFLAARGDIGPEARLSTLDRLTSFGKPWQVELRTSGRILEIRSNPMPDGGIVATYADITARVEADMALKRANETLEQRVESRTAELTRVNEELAEAQVLAEEANLGKTRFLAAAGHDILQPLNAARLYCSSLIEKAGKGDVGAAATSIEFLAGVRRDDPRRRAGHLQAGCRGDEAFADGLRAGWPAAPDRHGFPADGGRQGPRPRHRAVLPGGQDRPQPFAPAGPEPGFERGEVYARRPHPGRRPAARAAWPSCRSSTPASALPQTSSTRCFESSRALTKAPARPRALGSACRSSTVSRGSCACRSRSAPTRAGARASRWCCRWRRRRRRWSRIWRRARRRQRPRWTGSPYCASTTIRASWTACAGCSKAGAARSAPRRAPACLPGPPRRARRPTSCWPTITSTARTAFPLSSGCGPPTAPSCRRSWSPPTGRPRCAAPPTRSTCR